MTGRTQPAGMGEKHSGCTSSRLEMPRIGVSLESGRAARGRGRCSRAGGEAGAGPRRPVSSAHKSVCLQSTAGVTEGLQVGMALFSPSPSGLVEGASYRTREEAVFKQEVWWLGRGSGGGGRER